MSFFSSSQYLFCRFYESFQRRGDSDMSLEKFYHEYNPPITAKHHTCVGLGLDLAGRILELEKIYPGISSALFLASCEEVNNPGDQHRFIVFFVYTSL